MAKHPQNGPTFSKSPLKKRQPHIVASPTSKQLELEQVARDCAKSRRFHQLLNRDPKAAVDYLFDEKNW